MKLHREWKRIVARAWSVRLLALAAVLQGLEVVLPPFLGWVPEHWRLGFAILTCLVIAAAFVARITQQRGE